MSGPRPVVLRKGAIVSVPKEPGHWTTAQAYADVQFADGHVERWRGAWNASTDPGDLLAYGAAAAQEHDLVADYGIACGGAPRQALGRAPVEIVVEHVEARTDPAKL